MRRCPRFHAATVACGACGAMSTEAQADVCEHGHRGLVFRWAWYPARDETEAESEPEVLSVPRACHACNCDDPFCRRCYGGD